MLDYAEEVRRSVSMIDLVQRYGIEANRKGFMCCPFHLEKTASLKLYPNSFYCFGCGAHGSVIDFVMQYFNLPFHDALVKINLDFSLGLPIGEKPTLRQARACENKHRQMLRQKEEREKLEQARSQALDNFIRLDKQRVKYAPTAPDEELHPLFIEALQGIEYAKYALDEAETRLYDYGNKR